MPSISSNFLEVLIFLAPGLVVTFALRRESDFLQGLFNSIQTNGSSSSLAILLINAVALGLVVSGIATLFMPWLARLMNTKVRSDNKQEPGVQHYHQINFAKVYSHSKEALEALQNQTRIYMAYGSMAVALFLAGCIMAYSYYINDVPIENFTFKAVLLASFCIFMTCASCRYFAFLCHFNDQLQNTPPAHTPLRSQQTK